MYVIYIKRESKVRDQEFLLFDRLKCLCLKPRTRSRLKKKEEQEQKEKTQTFRNY